MNKRRTSVMVAVRDLDRRADGLLLKAAQLAKRFDAELDVLHVYAQPYAPDGALFEELKPEGVNAFIEPLRARLDKRVGRIQQSGVPVRSSVIWDYPASDAIVRQVLASKPDFLIIQSHKHGRLARWLLTNTDWELIRHCPCPLWIVKSTKLPPRLSVLAAVDPAHAHAKSARLDAQIVATAGRLARAGSRFGVCHVYALPPVSTRVMGEAVVVPPTPAEARRLQARAARSVDQLLTSRGQRIARRDRIVMAGDPVSLLPAIARRWKAHVLVMGAVSRSGLKRLFIGNTAERVLDAIDCDVLVVKSPSFKCPVRRTRGVQIVRPSMAAIR